MTVEYQITKEARRAFTLTGRLDTPIAQVKYNTKSSNLSLSNAEGFTDFKIVSFCSSRNDFIFLHQLIFSLREERLLLLETDW